MRESASEPLTTTSSHIGNESSGRPAPASQSEALKTVIQLQVQVEALTTTAQAAAKQARLLTQYVSTLGEVSSAPFHVADAELVQEHAKLKAANIVLECDLKRTREEGEAWKSLAQNVQEMQEMAMAAFERCNALEKENIELRQAMHTFAEGSASATVQQLQTIIVSLTEEVSQYKKREEDIKARELSLRNKENNSIIKAMRKQTKELKRRSLQKTLEMKTVDTKELREIKEAKETPVLGNKNTNANHTGLNLTRSTATSPGLPAMPTCQEFFFL
ncbi:uncharacterized protein PHACADRAFT_143775 [Phanerochaete carnosa HHB-10118-sp]|uniref:Uncharacterized protein n=1 Tax=Phanerochaete carnosa (strain HHB-10118-sp) TaxID=650164 RepID=K5WY72_PHACS|nr:uncharacterized protein PHACADRAFT_143775 [Phanerochaete carnosa HHB-10118-sp]EKM55442.1 hypothetical protein PHACADRAFT_143775 [Phanerochaete carnosa HHB-10118-sp]